MDPLLWNVDIISDTTVYTIMYVRVVLFSDEIYFYFYFYFCLLDGSLKMSLTLR